VGRSAARILIPGSRDFPLLDALCDTIDRARLFAECYGNTERITRSFDGLRGRSNAAGNIYIERS
jgi:hypothetical protein